MNARNDEPFLLQLLNLIGDLILLNVCFILCCLPIFTIGAACSALYDALFRMQKDQGHPVPNFFRSFRRSFVQSTLAFLVLLFFGAAIFASGYLQYVSDSLQTWSIILLGIAAFFALSVDCYVFPLIAQFENSLLGALRNGILLALTHLPATILLVLLNLAMPGAVLFATDLVLYYLMALVLLGFSVPAYFSALILGRIFRPFLQKKDPPADQ